MGESQQTTSIGIRIPSNQERDCGETDHSEADPSIPDGQHRPDTDQPIIPPPGTGRLQTYRYTFHGRQAK